MADTGQTKRILLKIEQDMDQAARAAEQLSRELKDARLAEQELKAGTDEVKLAQVQKARALEDARRATKDGAVAARRLKDALKDQEQQVKQNLIQIGNLKDAMVAGFGINIAAMAVGMLTRALGAAWAGFKRLVQAGIEWTGTVRGVESEVQRLSVVVDNLISEKALARLVEYGKQFKWTSAQVDLIAKASVNYARVAKVDFNDAVQTVTNAVVNCEQEGLRKLGLTLDDLSGTKSEKTAKVLDELARKFGDVQISASNAGEEHVKLGNTLDQVTDRIGAAIVESRAYRAVVSAVAGEVESWARNVGILETELQSLIITARGWSKVKADIVGGYETDPEAFAKMFGLDEASKKKLEDLREKRAAQELAWQQEEYDRRKRHVQKLAEVKADSHADADADAMREERRNNAKWREMQFRADQIAHQQRLRAELKFMSDLRKARQADYSQKIEILHRYTKAATDAALAEIVAGNGAAAAARAAGSAVLRELSTKAAGKAAWEAAEALAMYGRWAASWFTDGAALTSAGWHTAAAAGYGVLAGGFGWAANAVAPSTAGPMSLASEIAPSGAAGGHGGGGSSGGGSGGSSSGASGGGPVTNIYLKGRSGFVTRKDLKAFALRLEQGRA